MRPARYLKGSTRKIAQFTGDYDRERRQTVVNQTGWRYGLAGTDLGFSFEHQGRLHFLFGDSISANGYNLFRPEAGDAIASTSATDPENGISLEFWTAPDGQYRSPRVVPPIGQGSLEVPCSGFSVDGRMYVFFTTGHNVIPGEGMGSSVLTRLSDANQAVFTHVFDMSDRHTDGHFINVVPVIVDNASIPGLPDRTGRGLLLWGSGKYRGSNPYLAYMPLDSVEKPETRWYFSGTAGHPAWCRREADAKALFEHPEIGEFSVVWLADVQGWLMLYNAGNPRGINYRFAPLPWGPWTDAAVAFDPWCDGGYGHFMHASYQDHGRIDAVHDEGREHEWGGEYGPYVMERYTKRDGTQLNVYYVMSTWNPYNTMIMRTTFMLSAWRGWYSLPPVTFPTHSRTAAVTRHPDRMEVWAVGRDGIVRGNWFDAGWHGWYELTGMAFPHDTSLAAVSRHPDRLEVWAVDDHGLIHGNWFDGGWKGWYPLQGHVFNKGSRLAALSRFREHMEIWAVDRDGIIHGNWFHNGWKGWYSLPGAQFNQNTQIAALSRHQDRMEIWAIDKDGIMRGNWFDAGWHGWYELPGVTFNQGVSVAAVSRHPDRMEIWAIDKNGVLRGNWFDGGWKGWYSLDDARFHQDAPLVALSRAPERMEIWGVDENGTVRGRWFDRGWHPWYTLDGQVFSQGVDLSAVSRHQDRMEIWAIDPDGVTRGNWFDPT